MRSYDQEDIDAAMDEGMARFRRDDPNTTIRIGVLPNGRVFAIRTDDPTKVIDVTAWFDVMAYRHAVARRNREWLDAFRELDADGTVHVWTDADWQDGTIEEALAMRVSFGETVWCPVCDRPIRDGVLAVAVEQDFGPPQPVHARCEAAWYGDDGEEA